MRPVRYLGRTPRWFFHPYPRFGRNEQGLWGINVRSNNIIGPPAIYTVRSRWRFVALVKALAGRLS